MKRVISALLPLLLIGGGGCVLAPAGSGATPSPMPRAGYVTLQVENDNWGDVAVYLLRNQQEIRLGTVTTMSSQVFQVPESLVTGANEVRFVARPTGRAQVYTTEPISINTGQTLRLHFAPNLLLIR